MARESTSAEGRDPVVLRFREATEPPRVWSPLDAFLYNLMSMNVAASFGLLFVAGAAFYYPPRALSLAILVTGALCLGQAVVYAFLVSTLPRSGGDYLFQSRLVSPRVGSTFAFASTVIGGALWMALAGWFASRQAVGPLLILVGQQLRSAPLLAASAWVLSPQGVVVFGILATLWSGYLNLRGMRTYARLQRVLVVPGFVILLALVVFLAATRFGVSQATSRTMVFTAIESGFRRQGYETGMHAVWQLVPIAAFGLIYPGWAVFHAGEVRGTGRLRTQMTTIVGSKVAGIVFALIVLPLPIHYLGEELFGASTYLLLHNPRSFWVLAPQLFTGASSLPIPGSLVMVAISVAINLWFWIWVPNHTLAASRVLLAMSWDRVLPRWVSRLDGANGVPVNAVGLFTVLCIALVLAYGRAGLWPLALHATLVNLVSFAATCMAAALVAFTHRELYRRSTAAAFDWMRIPLISVAAAPFVVFAAFLAWQYVRVDALSLHVRAARTFLFVGGVYAASLAVDLVFRDYRRRHEGADAEIYFKPAASASGPEAPPPLRGLSPFAAPSDRGGAR